MRVHIQDRLEICDKSLHKTPEGFLQLQGIIARSGEQTYFRSELGIQDGADEQIILERPETEVTDAMSISSFMHKPITDNHPVGGHVDASNTEKLMKGLVTSVEPTEEGKLKADLLVTDAALVAAIENGKRELSAGYSAELDFSDDGKRATQRKIRGNHVAFVDKARCGRECTIFDSEKKVMAKMKISGVEIEIQDSAVPMVQQVVTQVESLEGKVKVLTDAESALQGKLDAANDKIKTLEGATLSDADVVKLAEGMAALWSDVKLIDKDFDCGGKTAVQVKAAIVIAKIGDSMKDKDDAYMAARFDVLVEDAKAKGKDPLSASLRDHKTGHHFDDGIATVADARQAKIDRNRDRNQPKSA